MSDDKPASQTFTITADDPATGTQIIRAQMNADEAAAEVDRMRAEGMENIKVTPTSNPAGSAG